MEYTILLKLQILEVATRLYNFSFIIWTHYFLFHSTDGLTRQNLIHPDFELKSIQNVGRVSLSQNRLRSRVSVTCGYFCHYRASVGSWYCRLSVWRAPSTSHWNNHHPLCIEWQSVLVHCTVRSAFSRADTMSRNHRASVTKYVD
jgi:hypothetical protein